MRINAIAIIQVGDYVIGGGSERRWSFRQVAFCIQTTPTSKGWQMMLMVYED